MSIRPESRLWALMPHEITGQKHGRGLLPGWETESFQSEHMTAWKTRSPISSAYVGLFNIPGLRYSNVLQGLRQISPELGQSYQHRPSCPDILQTVRSNQRSLSPEVLSGPLPSGDAVLLTPLVTPRQGNEREPASRCRCDSYSPLTPSTVFYGSPENPYKSY